MDGDPLLAWEKKIELVQVAKVLSRMQLLGRDFSDVYSPVGGRPITDWALNYDLIAASGVFTPEEERCVRRFLMLSAHMFMEPDMMNWQYNGRNANFEADRVEIIGTVGVVFAGNPDADAFVTHARSRIERILNVYCTPGSGCWFENPACYYLQSMKCWTSLACLMADHGLLDPTSIPRLKDFMSWGINLITAEAPESAASWAAAATNEKAAVSRPIRRIPPIGDHAGLGGLFPEQYAMMAKLYRQCDPAFADRLLWAYQAGGNSGGRFGNIPLLFASLSEADLRPAPPPALTSRRLEGFGAVFRGKFGKADEFYLLFKQGPGGYRYHRTVGVAVTGEGIDDMLWFARDGISFAYAKCRFDGRYGTLRRRTSALELILLDGRRIESDGIILESDGPAVQIRITGDRVDLTAERAGRVTVADQGTRKILTLDGKPIHTDWTR